MTYKTGSVGDFMQWTKRVVADPNLAGKMPKRWFDSDATAMKSVGTRTSPEALVKLLSPENLKVLHLIGTRRPGSVRELATLVDGRRRLGRSAAICFGLGCGALARGLQRLTTLRTNIDRPLCHAAARAPGLSALRM
jgi:hypothetical protein